MTDIITAGCEALELLYEGTSKAYRENDKGPSPGSQAAKELVTSSGRELVETAFSQGTMLIEVTADQAMACKKTLSIPMETFAPWTSGRAALEASALGCWLNDLDIDRATRIQRSFAFRYEGLVQQQKYLRTVGDIGRAKAVQDRIVKVEQDAVALGYPPLRDGKGRQIGLVMPSVTDVITKTLGKEEPYRLFSGVAHAHFWALHSLGLRHVPDRVLTEAGRSVPPKGAFVEKWLNPQFVAYLVTEIMDALAKVTWQRFVLFGWPRAQVEAAMEAAYDRLGIKEGLRFWRKNAAPS
jgi:hypothetical protein